MSWVAIGTTAASLGGKLLAGDGSKTVTQQPMLTQEQIEAMKLLTNFAKTGNYNGVKAGEAYGGPLGSYNTTGMENTGQNQLLSLMMSGMPGMYSVGANEINNLLNSGQYDPTNPTGEYAGFKKQALRELRESKDRMARDSAATGNLYSTDFARRTGDLEEQTGNALMSKTAQLYDTYVGRKLNAIPLALQAGQQAENTAMGRIDASQRYGGLSRNLENAKYQDAYNAWLKQRSEAFLPLQSAMSVAGSNPQWGTPSMTVPTQSPWGSFFDAGINMGTGMLGKDYANRTGIFKNTP